MPNIGEANISKVRLAEQGSDPATPASGFGYVYIKTDGLYFIGDNGTVIGPLVEAGGVKLDDWATPDDNTDLNASTSKHGLLPKLDNQATSFLNGQGSWAVPPGASGQIRSITFVIDGGGSEITDGIKGDLEIPFACTITAWTLLADTSGAIKIDIWMDTYANYPPTDADTITNAHEPEIAASGNKAQDTDLSDWGDVTIAAGQTLRFNVDSCTTITRCTLSLKALV